MDDKKTKWANQRFATGAGLLAGLLLGGMALLILLLLPQSSPPVNDGSSTGVTTFVFSLPEDICYVNGLPIIYAPVSDSYSGKYSFSYLNVKGSVVTNYYNKAFYTNEFTVSERYEFVGAACPMSEAQK